MAQSAQIIDTPCSHCQEWPLLASDLYCGGCGQMVIQLSLKLRPSVLVPEFMGSQPGVLLLANEDGRDLKIEVRADRKRSWLEHSPKQLALPAGHKAKVEIRLHGDRLPTGLREEETKLRLILNGNDTLYRDVPILVRTGPRPVVEQLNFGDLQAGSKRVRRVIGIRNDGGIPLRIESVEPFGSAQLGVAADVDWPIQVLSGERAEISVFWDPSIEEIDEDTTKGFILHMPQGKTLTVTAEASFYRYKLEAEPPKLEVQTSIKHQPRERITIVNQGTKELEVSNIETDVEWMRIYPDLEAQVLAAKGDESGDSQLSFEVVFEPAPLEAGEHRGIVRVSTLPLECEGLEVEVVLGVQEPRVHKDYIGIDFGTTNSVVAVFDKDSEPCLVEVLVDEEKLSPLIPSLLYFREDGSTVIGHLAKNLSASHAERVVRSVKRIVGTAETVEILGSSMTPEELTSHILRHLVVYAEQKLHALHSDYQLVRRAIATVPADFEDAQIEAILTAYEAAGIETERERAGTAAKLLEERAGTRVLAGIILDEPSAAALYFLHFLAKEGSLGAKLGRMINRKRGLNIFVYDHGGGTLDISIARATRLADGSIGLDIQAILGSNELGGDRIDVLLMRDRLADGSARHPQFDQELISPDYPSLMRRKEDEDWSSEDLSRVLFARREWKDAAEGLKLRLTSEKAAVQEVPGGAICHFDRGRLIRESSGVRLELTRDQFEERLSSGGFLVRCSDLVSRALGLAGSKLGDIDFLLHAGRQSLTPAIRNCINSQFEHLDENAIFDEEERLMKVCTAKGAALFGRSRTAAGKNQIQLVQKRRLQCAYGFEKSGTFGVVEFDEIIVLREIYPVEKEKLIDDLPAVGRLSLKIYQNVGRSKAIFGNDEVTRVGEAELSFDPTKTERLVLTLSVDANRSLRLFQGGEEIEIHKVTLHAQAEWMD